nr:3'(2'),5'-bisphosphate nucleotidase CysQ [Steroidobacter denitrificans]
MRRSELLSGKALGKAGDHIANTLIVDALSSARPDDTVLSEQEVKPERLLSNRVWIVDPLDGTREYGEGRTDWAVHVGFVHDGRAVAGAVALPSRGQILSTAHAVSAACPRGRLRMLVSRTRPATEAVAVAELLDAELIPMGSAGVKAMSVLLGEGDIYLHSGGQYEWDSCAPVAVALAAGLHASRIDGSALRYNRQNPLLPDLLICRPELADAVLDAVRRVQLR